MTECRLDGRSRSRFGNPRPATVSIDRTISCCLVFSKLCIVLTRAVHSRRRALDGFTLSLSMLLPDGLRRPPVLNDRSL